MRTPFRKSHGKITFVLYNRPATCGGRCVYCFTVPGLTKSTTFNEDTELARSCGWSGKDQLAGRFVRYGIKKGIGNKCDLAVKGDSFAAHDPDYMRGYVKSVYDFLNGIDSASLKGACELQKSGADRCVTFKVETRADQITHKTCQFFIELGVTTVELGVQSLYDDILALNERGYKADVVAVATGLLRSYGFEVCYQVMVGLPGSTDVKDRELLSEKLWQDQFSPDALKIYPCLLLKDDVAHHKRLSLMLDKGNWQPLDEKKYINMLNDCYPKIPRYVHINRIQRIIPPEKVRAGPARQINRIRFAQISKCLWQRSVAQKMKNLDADYRNYSIIDYHQGEKRFCFEAIVTNETVLGYGRLDLLPNRAAMIRDVRVLGNMLPVGKRNTLYRGCQHIGIGKSLIAAMEKKASSEGARFIFVKPSFGTVSWFANLGYFRIGDFYCGKELFARENCEEYTKLKIDKAIDTAIFLRNMLTSDLETRRY